MRTSELFVALLLEPPGGGGAAPAVVLVCHVFHHLLLLVRPVTHFLQQAGREVDCLDLFRTSCSDLPLLFRCCFVGH